MPTTPSPAVAPRRNRSGLIAALIVAGILLAPVVVAIVVVVQNDAAARAVEDELVAMPLPPSTELIDSYSQAGKLVGNGNGMQYLGALLLRSDLTVAELKAFYSEQADTEIFMEPSNDTQLSYSSRGLSAFLSQAGPADTFVVYMWGDAPSWFHRDVDLRGH